jgi:hypothetical protein
MPLSRDEATNQNDVLTEIQNQYPGASSGAGVLAGGWNYHTFVFIAPDANWLDQLYDRRHANNIHVELKYISSGTNGMGEKLQVLLTGKTQSGDSVNPHDAGTIERRQ